MKLFVTLTAALLKFTQTIWNLDFAFAIRLKAGRMLYFRIPVFCPDSIRFARARWPRQHRVGKLDADFVAQQSQHSFRIAQYIVGIDHGRDGVCLATDKIKDLCLLNKTEIVQLRFGVLLDVGGDYCRGIADEKTICYIPQPVT